MSSTLTDIKRISHEMFAPELAAEITREAEKDSGLSPGAAGPESIATFFAGDKLYADTNPGRLDGLPQVIWSGMFESERKPKFVYKPDPARPFRFIRSDDRVIEPRLMDTDGGSIPRILHGLARFDPWAYAPGYMIHDWIFIAHKCNYTPDNDISFEDSASILAECMKTQMEVGFTDFDGNIVRFPKLEDTMYVIYKAVSSQIARNIWNDPGSTTCR